MYTGLADLIISISPIDKKFFENKFPNKKHILIQHGIDFEYFSNFIEIYSTQTNLSKSITPYQLIPSI